jgi:hypothetical protein
MTESPETVNPFVAATKRLVQMSIAITRLTLGSRAAARISAQHAGTPGRQQYR